MLTLPLRTLLAVTVAVTGAGLAHGASAATAPKSSPTSTTLFLRQDGCGTTQGAGRLETTAGGDSSNGCGTIGGLPIEEVFYQAGAGTSTAFTSVAKGFPLVLDAARPITGQVTSRAWVGRGTGGVGNCAWDISLIGSTTAGKTIDFGSTKVTTAAAPTQGYCQNSWSLAVPAAANGVAISRLTLSLDSHGANIGMSAQGLNGDSYLVLPTKVVKPAGRRHR